MGDNRSGCAQKPLILAKLTPARLMTIAHLPCLCIVSFIELSVQSDGGIHLFFKNLIVYRAFSGFRLLVGLLLDARRVEDVPSPRSFILWRHYPFAFSIHLNIRYYSIRLEDLVVHLHVRITFVWKSMRAPVVFLSIMSIVEVLLRVIIICWPFWLVVRKFSAELWFPFLSIWPCTF